MKTFRLTPALLALLASASVASAAPQKDTGRHGRGVESQSATGEHSLMLELPLAGGPSGTTTRLLEAMAEQVAVAETAEAFPGDTDAQLIEKQIAVNIVNACLPESAQHQPESVSDQKWIPAALNKQIAIQRAIVDIPKKIQSGLPAIGGAQNVECHERSEDFHH